MICWPSNQSRSKWLHMQRPAWTSESEPSCKAMHVSALRLKFGQKETYTYIHTYIPTYIHAYIHTNIHTSMHAYTHECMHAYNHTRNLIFGWPLQTYFCGNNLVRIWQFWKLHADSSSKICTCKNSTQISARDETFYVCASRSISKLVDRQVRE